MTTGKRDYKAEIDELLSHYEDGRDIFKKADDWDYPVRIKPGHEVADLPDTWMGLAEKVIGILAHGKYELETYPNTIEIIDSELMLDAYASNGMPVSYQHWSFGKNREAMGKAYKQGQMGLAYEIVINTNPAIAYCMAQNTKTMQLLVIAHASFGHNSFFKNNHMFKQFTKADDILADLQELKEYVAECEEKYGIEEVEKLLDICHALESHGVDLYTRPPARTAEEEAIRRMKIEEARQQEHNPVIENMSGLSKLFRKVEKQPDGNLPNREENLLHYIASDAPHLRPWQREIMKKISHKAQYFYPQRQTQVMNEGWASFWHHTLMNDMMFDLDLIDDGMMQEFIDSHSGVLNQRDFTKMNPYALGFAIFQDIKRICENPTNEDRAVFPYIAGNDDWLSTLKFAMENFKDESFILQYLSPKVIRDFHMFSIRNDDKEYAMEVTAIHDEDGYKAIRRDLAARYCLSNQVPQLEAVNYNYRGDRSLTIQHTMHNRKPLDKADTEKVLPYIHQVWGHPVILNSVDEDGKIVETFNYPPIKKDPALAPKRQVY